MLMSYPDAPAPRGSRLVPDAAAAMPQVSRDGKTYTFRLRSDRRFSDGSRVTPRSFKHALTRVLNREMRSPGRPFFVDIVGAKAFVEHRARTVVGISVVRGNRLRIRLKKRARTCSRGWRCPLHARETRHADLFGWRSHSFVGSGPYYIAERVPKRSIVLRRNRFYRGPRPHKVNEIVYEVGLPLSTIRLNIEEGDRSWACPLTAHAELALAMECGAARPAATSSTLARRSVT